MEAVILIFLGILVVWLLCIERGLLSPIILTTLAHIVYFGIGLTILGDVYSNYKPLLLLTVSLYSLSLGYVLGYRMITYDNATRAVFQFKPIKKETFFLCFIFCVGLYIYNFIKIGGIPLLKPSLRDIPRGIPGDFADISSKILVLLTFLYYKLGNIKYKKYFVIFVLISFSYYFLLLSRHPILEILLMLCLISSIYNKINIKKLFLLIAILLSLILGLGAFRLYIYNRTLPSMNEIVFSIVYKRVFMIGAKTLYFIFDSWSSPYYGLTFIKRIYNLFSFNPIPNLGYLLFTKVTGNEGGYDPVSLIGEMYINFGIYGIVVFVFIFGVITGACVKFTKIKAKRDPHYAIFYAYLSVLLIRTFAYSLAGFLFAIIAFIIIYWCIRVLNQLLTSCSFELSKTNNL